jgi:hypothetical protein
MATRKTNAPKNSKTKATKAEEPKSLWLQTSLGEEISEQLLQYIWQMQYFNVQGLATVDDEPIAILKKGDWNSNQGPDFINGKIKISNTTWAGNIELHVRSSEWQQHQHSTDKNYDNIILHVVWENDLPIKDKNGTPIPTLEMKNRIATTLLKHYQVLMLHKGFVPCENHLQKASTITWQNWKHRLLVERLEKKVALVQAHLRNTNNHWEETFWRMLARNFGVKINQDSFESIATTVNIQLLAKHKNQIHQLEALLLGQAGMLNSKTDGDDYQNLLVQEYAFLKNKYQLVAIKAPVLFLRMRPSNFPSIRLAQLAMLVQQSNHLFSKIRETKDGKTLAGLLDVTANDYWHYHYKAGDDASAFKPKHLGAAMVNNIIINTIVPVLFAHGQMHNDEAQKNKALAWLESTEKENNAITNNWEAIGVQHQNGFDSQALIQLYNDYCKQKNCLQCAIGHSVLKEMAK